VRVPDLPVARHHSNLGGDVRTIPYLSLAAALAGVSPSSTSWRWFLALSDTDRWRLMDGPATLVITGDSVRGQLRDAADTTRIRLSFEGTLRGDSACVLVKLADFDAEAFPARGELQRLCDAGHGRQLWILVAEGAAIGLTRDVSC
jgi:hypothetical protein